MFNPLKLFDKLVTWYSEKISRKARIMISVFVLLFCVGVLFTAYKINDYFENNPNACSTCHVHPDANKAWAVSVHRSINCHECHHSTKQEQMVQMYKFVFLGQKTVNPRHGEVIVPWKLCFSCHWDKNPKYPNAPNISSSRYHAKHVFNEKIECTKCHGYKTHKFSLEERYCVTCHKDKEIHQHMAAKKDSEQCAPMESFACMNCHTDRTRDLKPERKKCLYCHGGEDVRKELTAGGTIDVKHFQPSPEVVKRAIKINVPANAPMQFNCYECHNPHKKLKPDAKDCLSKCHTTVPSVGKHEVHIKMMNMKCIDCHKVHVWKVTEAQAKKDCIKCHEYKDPKKFIGS